MTNTELILKIRAEIERHKELFKEACDNGSYYACARRDEANEILKFLSTLESEKPMEGLEEEIDRFEDWMETYNQADYPTSFTTRDIARHFAQWQKEQDDKELSDLLTIAHLQGADQMKEQMLKEAVEGVVCYGSKGAYIETDFLGEYDTDVYGNPGDKVRIIIVKEDEK